MPEFGVEHKAAIPEQGDGSPGEEQEKTRSMPTIKPGMINPREGLLLLAGGAEVDPRGELIERVIGSHGEDPMQYLLKEINTGAEIIAVGEDHGYAEMEQNFVALVEGLQESNKSVARICLEIPQTITVTDARKQIENYMRGNDVFQDDFLGIHTVDFKRILDVARENNIAVVCVGDSDPMERSKSMHKQVLDAHVEGKGITMFYCGNSHLRNPYEYPEDKGEPILDQRKTGVEPEDGRSLTDSSLFRSVRQEEHAVVTENTLVRSDCDPAFENSDIDPDDPLEGTYSKVNATVFLPASEQHQ